MTDNVENVDTTTTETTETSQPETTPNTETSDATTATEVTATAVESTATAEDDELSLPDPDIVEDEANKKKSQPEWLKKKLERERAKEGEIKAEAERLRQENASLRAGIPQAAPVQQQQQQQPPAYDPYMPQRENYNNDGEYFLALGDYRDNKRFNEQQHHQRQATIAKHEKEFQDNLTGAIESG